MTDVRTSTSGSDAHGSTDNERNNATDCGAEVGADCSVRTLQPAQALSTSSTKPSTTKLVAPVTSATCTCASDAYPRGCFECLNQLLPGQDCALTSDGLCIDIGQYNWRNDYRRYVGVLSNGTGNTDVTMFFPSTNTTFCDLTDRTCNACRDAWSYPALNPKVAALPFCRGENGCVCVRDCLVGGASLSTLRYCSGQQTAWAWMTGWSRWGMFSMFIVMLIGVAWLYSRTRQYERHTHFMPQRGASSTAARLTVEPSLGEREPNNRRRASTGPKLELKGWQSMRESLIQAERSRAEETATDRV